MRYRRRDVLRERRPRRATTLGNGISVLSGKSLNVPVATALEKCRLSATVYGLSRRNVLAIDADNELGNK